MNQNKLQSHIESLRREHRNLDNQITESYLHHDSDQKIKTMKVKKLQIKKEIAWLEGQQNVSTKDI